MIVLSQRTINTQGMCWLVRHIHVELASFPFPSDVDDPNSGVDTKRLSPLGQKHTWSRKLSLVSDWLFLGFMDKAVSNSLPQRKSPLVWRV